MTELITMKLKTILILLISLNMAPIPAAAFDYHKAVSDCINEDAAQKLAVEYRSLRDTINVGLRDELNDHIAKINRDVRDGYLFRRDAIILISKLRQEYQQEINISNLGIEEKLKIIETSDSHAICIYKFFLRGDTYQNPSFISRLISGSPETIAENLMQSFGEDRYLRALALKWWCDNTQNSVCYFNY